MIDRRFQTAMPQVLEAVQDALRNVHDVSNALVPDDAAPAIASTIASSIRSTLALAAYLSRTHESHDTLPTLFTTLDRLIYAATNDAHDGLFDAIAMPRYEQWPPIAKQHVIYDDEIIYIVHDEHGNIFGHPELTDGHVWLWYWDPRTAAAHLNVLRCMARLRELRHRD